MDPTETVNIALEGNHAGVLKNEKQTRLTPRNLSLLFLGIGGTLFTLGGMALGEAGIITLVTGTTLAAAFATGGIALAIVLAAVALAYLFYRRSPKIGAWFSMVVGMGLFATGGAAVGYVTVLTIATLSTTSLLTAALTAGFGVALALFTLAIVIGTLFLIDYYKPHHAHKFKNLHPAHETQNATIFVLTPQATRAPRAHSKQNPHPQPKLKERDEAEITTLRPKD